MDRERRPIGPSYVITQGTFLIGSLGNYLIADSRVGIGSGGQVASCFAGLVVQVQVAPMSGTRWGTARPARGRTSTTWRHARNNLRAQLSCTDVYSAVLGFKRSCSARNGQIAERAWRLESAQLY